MSKLSMQLTAPRWVRIVYDPSSLPFLCHFGHEQLRMAEMNSWLTKRALIRIAFMCVCVSLVAGWHVFYPWHDFWYDYACLGLLIQLFSLFICFVMPFNLGYKRNYGLMAANHLLMTVSVLFHTCYLFVYWTLVWDDGYRKNRGYPGRVEYLVLLHTVPAFTALANFAMTDVILYRRHVSLLMALEVVVMMFDCIAVRHLGRKPQLWLLPWHSYKSAIVAVAILVSSYTLLACFVQMSEWVRGRQVPQSHLKQA